MAAAAVGALSLTAMVWVAAPRSSWAGNGAAANEPARVRVAAALVDDVARALLPIEVVLPAPLAGSPDGGAAGASSAALLTELRYCGVSERGNGHFRAVLHPAPLVGASARVLAGDDACRGTLSELAGRGAASGARGEPTVADVEAVWRPWELRLVVTRVTGPAPGRPAEPRPLVVVENRRDLLLLSTAGYRVITDRGDLVTLHLAPVFAADSLELVAVLGENGVAPSSGRLGATGAPPPLAAGATVTADLPHAFANQLLHQVMSAAPLAMSVEREVIDVQNVNLAGGPGGAAMTATVLATPRSLGESARVTVQSGGEEAAVLGVRADAVLENCAGLGTVAAIGCTARNAGLTAAAAALGAALSQRYQGQLLRQLAGTQTLRFDVAQRRLEFQGDVLHVLTGTRATAVAARIGLGGVTH